MDADNFHSTKCNSNDNIIMMNVLLIFTLNTIQWRYQMEMYIHSSSLARNLETTAKMPNGMKKQKVATAR